MIVAETERLVLRHQTEADAPFVLALINDPDWIRYIGDRGVRTVDEAAKYIRDGAMAMYARSGFGLWLVERREDREPLGLCGLIRRDFLPDVDLGFAFAAPHRRKGYAREASEATLAFARAQGMERVAAIVSPGNAPSIALLEGLGFAFERPFDYPGGDRVQLYVRAVQ